MDEFRVQRIMDELLKNLKELDVDRLPDVPKLLKGIIKLLIQRSLQQDEIIASMPYVMLIN